MDDRWEWSGTRSATTHQGREAVGPTKDEEPDADDSACELNNCDARVVTRIGACTPGVRGYPRETPAFTRPLSERSVGVGMELCHPDPVELLGLWQDDALREWREAESLLTACKGRPPGRAARAVKTVNGARRAEAFPTLADGGCRHEQANLLSDSEGPLLLYVMDVEDVERSHQTATRIRLMLITCG
jgi:hypothetical protein